MKLTKTTLLLYQKQMTLASILIKKNKQGEDLVCLMFLGKAIRLAKVPIVTLTNRLFAHQKRY